MTVVIVDDEAPARDLVKQYISTLEEIEVVGEASNGFEGHKLITSLHPDVVLLDIQMPKLNGFEMLELIDKPPSIIFCTAYDEYAIKAFEQNAVDYLLKPFSKTRLLEALQKVKGTTAHEPYIYRNVEYAHPLSRIVVNSAKSIEIIPVENIYYLMSQDDYVEIHSSVGKHLKQQRLKYYETALDRQQFVRVHRQYIVHVGQIRKLDKYGKESYTAQLIMGETIPVSASGYIRLRQVLDM
ncbi:MAG: response regulator [Cyclobacteriaceae bacterium]|nr:response regulator [Cyclobacteriaceae bacterium]